MSERHVPCRCDDCADLHTTIHDLTDEIVVVIGALGDALDEIWEHRKRANPSRLRHGLETLTVPQWLNGDRGALLPDEDNP